MSGAIPGQVELYSREANKNQLARDGVAKVFSMVEERQKRAWIAGTENTQHSLLALVRPRGLEPPRVSPLAPQASASTNSAMAAYPARRALTGDIGNCVV